jgi:hypothetical protein
MSRRLVGNEIGEASPMKFSIRDLMWLTVVVALVMGWGMDHWRQSPELKKAKEIAHQAVIENYVLRAILEQHGVKVKFRDDTNQNPLVTEEDGTTHVFSANDLDR